MKTADAAALTTRHTATPEGLAAVARFAEALAAAGMEVELREAEESLDGLGAADKELVLTWRAPGAAGAEAPADWEAEELEQGGGQDALPAIWRRRVEMFAETIEFLARAPDVLPPAAPGKAPEGVVLDGKP